MSSFPWRRPRFEVALLVLVAAAALSQVYDVSSQDVSRLCLSRALEHRHVTIQPCSGGSIDRAVRDGKTYSDKAPGVAVLALPAVAALQLKPSDRWTQEGDPSVWAVRLLVGGVPFLLLAFAVGRVAEGLRSGTGGAVLVTFALGTLAGPLAATTFGHDAAAAAVFGAFLFAWRRQAVVAGVLAGCAVAIDYTTALVGLALALYVLVGGLRACLRYAIGALPPLALLGIYNQVAFGSPLHLSYRYVVGSFASEQSSGFFGVHWPTAHGLHEVFLGDRGLLVASPVLVAAAVGLVILGRDHRREAVLCAIAAALSILIDVGYFLPYGGTSPGPRYVVPALPFLAIGLAPAFAQLRAVTSALAAVSLTATTAVMVTWADSNGLAYRDTIWGELVRLPRERGSSPLVTELTKNVAVWAGDDRIVAATLVAFVVATAFVLGIGPGYVNRARSG